MKKLLALAVVALFAVNANANVRLENGLTPAVPVDGTMNFDLEVRSTFVYKLLNDKADADAGVAGQDEGADSSIDLGEITAGVADAGISHDCGDLVGLTQAIALGNTAIANEAETGLPVSAQAASCHVDRQGSDVSLRMAIPLQAILMKTGAGLVDITYSVPAAVAGVSFNAFRLCNGAALNEAGLMGASLPTCAAKTNPTAVGQGHNDVMHVLLEARLSGSGSQSSFHDQVDIAITESI